MRIIMLNNKTLLVPKRIGDGDTIIDAMVEIQPDEDDYKKYLELYRREQELERREE